MKDFYKANSEIDRILPKLNGIERRQRQKTLILSLDKYREKSMELKIRGAFATTDTSEPILSVEQTDLRNVLTADHQLKGCVYMDHQITNLEPASTLMNGSDLKDGNHITKP
jgi:hypothetical protein